MKSPSWEKAGRTENCQIGVFAAYASAQEVGVGYVLAVP
jgi:hypothetical protein